MATATPTAKPTEQGLTIEEKIQRLRELYADAPEIGRVALEGGLPDLRRELAAATGLKTPVGSALAKARSRSSPGSFRSRKGERSGFAACCNCYKATSSSQTWWARSTTCASCSW